MSTFETKQADEVSTEPVEEKKSSKLKDFLRDWFVYRIPAALIWYWGALLLLGKGLPFGVTLPRLYLIVPVAIWFVILVVAHKWLRAVFYPFYVISFPVLMLLNASVWFFTTFRKAIGLPVRAFRFITSGTTFFILFVATIAGWIVAFSATVPSTRGIAALSAHTALYLLFLRSFRWASNPFRFLSTAIEFLSKRGRKLFEDIYIKPGFSDAGEKRKMAIKMCDWYLKSLDKLYEANAPLKRGLTSFTHGSVMPVFIFSFTLLYFLLAISFSITTYEVQRAWGPLVEGLGNTTPRLTYFYFSFLSQALAVPDNMQPVSVYGQLWVIWHVLTGILLLTSLITLFTTSFGIHGESTLSEVRNFSERTRTDLTAWRTQLEQPAIDVEATEVTTKTAEGGEEVVDSTEGGSNAQTEDLIK